MNENVIMLICYIPTPIIFLIAGLLMWRFPSPYGDAIGYKTKLAYSSREAWDYAQVTFGKLCALINAALLTVSLGVGVFQVVKNVDETLGIIICLSVVTIQLVPVFVCIFITEAKLKKYFGR